MLELHSFLDGRSISKPYRLLLNPILDPFPLFDPESMLHLKRKKEAGKYHVLDYWFDTKGHVNAVRLCKYGTFFSITDNAPGPSFQNKGKKLWQKLKSV
jgi:hypothetical protein